MVLLQWISAGIFALALIHTFSTKFFEHLAHTNPAHAGVWHLLGEVEVVFGFWALVLVLVMAAMQGPHVATQYLDTRNFTEPLFVFAIMVVAGSRAILQFARVCVTTIARFIPLKGGIGFYFVVLTFTPLLSSFITEPGAMTLAALMLRDYVYAPGISKRLKYATIGLLFVNVSIGGTLTPFAAPPVLMVAEKWNLDLWFMLSQIGWKAALAVGVNALATTFVFRRELSRLNTSECQTACGVPSWAILIHILFLAGVVVFAHHSVIFMGLFLFFLGFAKAYPQFQNRLILREGLLVAFFLAGLVVIGGQQQWWLEYLLRKMSSTTVYFGATLLTGVTDNAALTYLASLVEGLTPEFKYAVLTGAVTGGGLTVIANAPNPAGYSILRGQFDEDSIHPAGLLLAAIPFTIVAILAFRLL